MPALRRIARTSFPLLLAVTGIACSKASGSAMNDDTGDDTSDLDGGGRRDTGRRRDGSATPGDDATLDDTGEGAGDGSADLDASTKDLGLPQFDGSLPTYTYWQDIRPILVRRCLSCHSSPPRFGATTSEATWADTQLPDPADGQPEFVHMGWRVENTVDPMPPANAPTATQAERDMIYIWSITGALEGMPPDAGVTGDAGQAADAAPGADGGSGGLDAAPGDAAPQNPLTGIGTVAQVGPAYSFLGGIRWRARDGYILFTDVTGNTIHQLLPPSTFDSPGPYRMNSMNANGLNFDPQGRLLVCEHGSRSVTRTDLGGNITTVASQYMGLALNSPNDVIVRSDGTVYFTDPPYGLNGRPRGVQFNGVFRIDLGGVLHVEYMGAINPPESRPNGITLSPDERTAYVSDTTMNLVRAYDVNVDGSFANERVFVAAINQPDGLVTDDLGNLYISATLGVVVYAPDGRAWGTIQVPTLQGEIVGNLTFGGTNRDVLYMIARTQVFRVQMTVTGRN
jgi:gluconolactonase